MIRVSPLPPSLVLSGILVAIPAVVVGPSIRWSGRQRGGSGAQDRDRSSRAPEGFRQLHRKPDHDAAQQAGAREQARAPPQGHRGRRGTAIARCSCSTAPRDVKGTAFLVHAHKTESDEQWLYLPGLKRVKRISLLEAVRLLHGERILVRGHGRNGGGEVHPPAPARRAVRRIWNAPFPSVSRPTRIPGTPVSLSGSTGRSFAPCRCSTSTAGARNLKTMAVEGLPEVSRQLLAGRQGVHDEPPHGKEHRAALVGLQVRDRHGP